MIFAVIAWAVCGLLGYAVGSNRGRGGDGAALGFFLGPFGVIGAMFLGDKRTRCQFCREPVAPDATVCPHCQKAIKPAYNVLCPACGKGFNVSPAALGHVARCPKCKKMVPTKKAAAPAP
jgi:hypothetical protein